MRVNEFRTEFDIAPNEAVKLSGLRTTDDIYIALELYNNCRNAFPAESNSWWKWVRTLATIWNAGRIHGVREERAKRRKVALNL